MKMSPRMSKRAAMEMSVGTIVTIVLLMTVLILGLVMIRTIFKGSIENINTIDQSVKNEISKLFSEDTSKRIVVYPTSKKVIIQKGEDSLGFGFSLRNVESEQKDFTYRIEAVDSSCNMNFNEAEKLIALGRVRTTPITLPPGTFMDDPIFVRFGIPETTPPCLIKYEITVESNGEAYTRSELDLEIKSE
jgi:hypothetical protein